MNETAPDNKRTRAAVEENTDRLDILRRWPRLCAHIISESLGYATPYTAAYILLCAKFGEECWTEWTDACWQRDARALLRHVIRNRHYHEGPMSHYSDAALPMVHAVLKRGSQPDGMLAAWF